MTENQGWLTQMQNMPRTGHSLETLAPPLGLDWKYFLGGNVWTSPVINSQLVFIAGERLHAISLDLGKLIWKSDEINAYGGGISGTLWQDMIFVCGNDHLFAIDIHTGQTKFKIESWSNHSTPCVFKERVYWVSGDGYLYAANARTGEVEWTLGTGKNTHFTPAVEEDMVFFCSYHELYAIDARLGSLKWKWNYFTDHPTPKARGNVAIYEGKVFVSIERQGLFSLDAITGNVNWHYKTEFGPFTAPCVAEDVVYVASRQLHAVHANSGEELWKSVHKGALTTSAPIISGETIYIGGGNSYFIYGFNRRTGEMTWKYPVGDMVFSTPAIASERLLVGCHDGYLYCFAKEEI